MTDKEIEKKLRSILLMGDGGDLIELMGKYGDDVTRLMRAGIAAGAQVEPPKLPTINCWKCQTPYGAPNQDGGGRFVFTCNTCGASSDEEGFEKEEASEDQLPGEDMEMLRRLEAQHDAHADPEGGDLYDDADNPFIECPACGSDECNVKDCKGREITDPSEVSALLLNREVDMYNPANGHKGEVTTLDATDIANIIHDMRPGLGNLRTKVEINGDKVTVSYPNNVCTLVTREAK